MNRVPSPHGERGRPFLSPCLRLDGVVNLLGLAVVRLGQPHRLQPLHRLAGQRLPSAQQLVDLAGRHPVMLSVVEDSEQDMEVTQGLGKGQLRGLPQKSTLGAAGLAAASGSSLGTFLGLPAASTGMSGKQPKDRLGRSAAHSHPAQQVAASAGLFRRI